MHIRPFRDGDAFQTLLNIVEQTVREIEALENDYVLKASPVELEQYYVSKVTISPLTLSAKDYYIDKQEGTQIDVSHDFRRARFGNERILVKGTALDIAIPFTGDPYLWRIRPSTYSVSGYPELEIRDGVVIFSCSFPDDSPESERLKTEIERSAGWSCGSPHDYDREFCVDRVQLVRSPPGVRPLPPVRFLSGEQYPPQPVLIALQSRCNLKNRSQEKEMEARRWRASRSAILMTR